MRKPFFRTQNQCWYVWEQTPKGPKCVQRAKDKDEAFRHWHERQARSESIRNDTTVKDLVDRLLDWAIKRGLLDKNPIVGIEWPREESSEVYIQPKQWQRLMEAVSDPNLRDLLTVLRETGCLPFEARMVEARHVDRARRAWVFEASESKENRERRVVYLTDTAWEITQRLMLTYPEGPLFRNKRGTPWSSAALGERMSSLRRRTGIECTAYAIRHTFIIDSLTNGADPVTVANRVGYKGLDRIHRVYSQLPLRPDYIQAALKKALGGLMTNPTESNVMAKTEAVDQNDFVMLDKVRALLRENPKLTGKETLAALKERFPQQTIRGISLRVAYSRARRELGITTNRKVLRRKPAARGAHLSPEQVVDMTVLEAACKYLIEVGDADAAIAAVRQVQALQLK